MEKKQIDLATRLGELRTAVDKADADVARINAELMTALQVANNASREYYTFQGQALSAVVAELEKRPPAPAPAASAAAAPPTMASKPRAKREANVEE